MYTYNPKPFNETIKFTVHSLNEPGIKTYTGPDSHCYHYLHRTDPKVFRQFMKIDCCTESDEVILERKKTKKLENEPEMNKEHIKTEIPKEENKNQYMETEIPKGINYQNSLTN